MGTPGPLTNTATVFQGPGAGFVRVLEINGVATGRLENVTITGGYFNDNANGAGIYIVGGSTNIVLSGCTITGNKAALGNGRTVFGGGFYAAGTYGMLTNCIVRANSVSGGNATCRGGGIYLTSGGWTLVDTTISRNSAYSSCVNNLASGGGLYVNSGTHELRNCVVLGNNVSGSGGAGSSFADGVLVVGGSLTVRNTDVLLNGGQGLWRAGGTLTVIDSILWGNGDDVYPGIASVTLSHCDVEDGDNAGSDGCISTNPCFERGLYLAVDSPCVNMGSDQADNVGMAGLTTRADGTLDTSTVDMGYHYAGGLDADYAELFVKPDGDNDARGTNWATAFETVTEALSVARDGSRVHLASGTYNNGSETFPLRLRKHGLQLLGTNAATTRLDAQSAGQRAVMVENVSGDTRLEKLSIVNGSVANCSGVGVYVLLSDLTIAGCIVSGHFSSVGNHQSSNGAGVYAYGSSGMITGCTIRANSSSGSNPYLRGAGLYLSGGNWVIVGTDIVQNTVTRNYDQNGGWGGGVYAAGAHVFRNCVVAKNRVSSVRTYGDGLYVGSGVSIENCTIAGNSGEGLWRASGTIPVLNSILWGNGDDVAGTESGVMLDFCCIEDGQGGCGGSDNITDDPLFADAAGSDYHLLSQAGRWDPAGAGSWVKDDESSPCIDAGDSLSDWTEEPAPNGGRINIGAYGGTAYASKTAVRGTLFLVK